MTSKPKNLIRNENIQSGERTCIPPVSPAVPSLLRRSFSLQCSVSRLWSAVLAAPTFLAVYFVLVSSRSCPRAVPLLEFPKLGELFFFVRFLAYLRIAALSCDNDNDNDTFE